VAGRIHDELRRNGAVNWDADYRKMAKSFCRYVQQGTAVDDKSANHADAFASAVDQRQPAEDDAVTLIKIALDWVRRNPKPIRLGKPSYRH
jgi:hypothetical protein